MNDSDFHHFMATIVGFERRVLERLDKVLVALEKLERTCACTTPEPAGPGRRIDLGDGSHATVHGDPSEKTLMALRALADAGRRMMEPTPKVQRLLHVLAETYDKARSAIIRLGGFAAGERVVLNGNRWLYVSHPSQLRGYNRLEIMAVSGFGKHSTADEILRQIDAIRSRGEDLVKEQECPR